MDKDSAKLLRNSNALKKDLSREANTFVVLFEYGNFDNKQGYWSYEHLVLKMEDFLECLKVMYSYFDLVFLFDHSCGHDRTREGRLKESIMIKYFCGKNQI